MGSMAADYMGVVLPPVRNSRKSSMPQYLKSEAIDTSTSAASGSGGPRSAFLSREGDAHDSMSRLRPTQSYTVRQPRTQERSTHALGLFPAADRNQEADRLRSVPTRRRTTSQDPLPTYSILFDEGGRPRTAPVSRSRTTPFVTQWVQDQAGPSGSLAPGSDIATPSPKSPDNQDGGDGKGGWMTKVKAKLKPKKSAKLRVGRDE